jgi:hypothetical protein
MSLLPDETDFAFLKEWAIKKIMADLDAEEFLVIANFSKSFAYFILQSESSRVIGEDWIHNRLFDICYIAREMRGIPGDIVGFKQLEMELIELLGLITEYHEINRPHGETYVGHVSAIPIGWGKCEFYP